MYMFSYDGGLEFILLIFSPTTVHYSTKKIPEPVEGSGIYFPLWGFLGRGSPNLPIFPTFFGGMPLSAMLLCYIRTFSSF